jgi:hypothetical protein
VSEGLGSERGEGNPCCLRASEAGGAWLGGGARKKWASSGFYDTGFYVCLQVNLNNASRSQSSHSYDDSTLPLIDRNQKSGIVAKRCSLLCLVLLEFFNGLLTKNRTCIYSK